MIINSSRSVIKIIALFTALLFAVGESRAHGGEDHSAPTVRAVAAPGQLSVVAYPASYEVFLRYSPPELGVPALLKIFISQWATNRPIDASNMSLEFPGAKSPVTVGPIRKVADGTYEVKATFKNDEEYSALLKFTSAGVAESAALSPLYAGPTAKKKVAVAPTLLPADTSSGIPLWLILTVLLVLLILAVLLRKQRQKRLLIATTHKSNKSEA